MVVAGMAVSLSGCDDTAKWFAKPLNLFNNNPGYNYSSLGDARVDRAITANDLVDAGGACPNYAGPDRARRPIRARARRLRTVPRSSAAASRWE